MEKIIVKKKILAEKQIVNMFYSKNVSNELFIVLSYQNYLILLHFM